MTIANDLTGRQIKGYELREKIGAGGFGAVYRAYQPMIDREVAIKIILPQYANQPDFIRRFEVEAQVIARLEHPYIIPLYDFWRDPEGAYLVMRFLRGGSLRSKIDHEGALSLSVVNRILNQVAAALAVAHRQDVIHRDIKPDNILLDEEGNAYLTDFGIAKDLTQNVNVTQADTVVGSPAYLSPEQVKAEAVTPRSDIYSLGIVLYEMIAGQHPFPDQLATSLMLKHLNEPVPRLSDHLDAVPVAVESIIHRATAKDPADRYTDVQALAAAFQQVLVLEEEYNDMDTNMRITMPRMAAMDETMLFDDVDVDNPYKGLEAFEEADSANFFGRDALITRLLDRLRWEEGKARFLAVIGPSGSGKSSVVQAGVIPRMRGGTLPGSSNWFIVEMLPGTHPLEELEAALLRIAVNPPDSLLAQLKEDERGLLRATKRVIADNKSELFLFIDQFEEVFTRSQDPKEVEHFLNSLTVAVSDPACNLRVVITLRADFYDRPLLYPAFGDLVRQNTEVVLPMTPDELERAIAGPAERVGMMLEPGLTAEIIADVSQQPGALPLLQYALTELFERRSGRVLTRDAYHEIGGALGALASRAEERYDSLDAADQAVARSMFLRLVRVGESSSEDARRRVLQTALTATGGQRMIEVINAFGRARLLTFDRDPNTREPTVEVAHEALIREWGRLRDWLEDSREDLLMERRLESAAADWDRAERDASYLLRGARLAQFEEWHTGTDMLLNEREAALLRESIAQRQADEAAEAERIAREEAAERRSRNLLRLLLAVMTVAALIAGVLAVVAFNQSEAAQVARAAAEAARSAAEDSAREASSLALAANARNLLAEDNPPLALALAIEADRTYQPAPAEVQQTLARVAYGPGARFHLQGHDGSVMNVASSGALGFTTGMDGSLILWDLLTGEQQPVTFDLGGQVAASVAMTADGRQGLTGLFSGDIVLWDLETGEERQRFTGHTDIVNSIAFSPDETQFISGAMDRTLRLWDVASGDELLQIDSPGVILSVAFSPDGTRAATSSADVTAGSGHPPEERDRTVRVWDLSTGAEIRRFEPNSGFVRAVAYSPDGRYVLSGTWNSTDGGTLQLWDIETGELFRRFYGHSDIITSVGFSADGQTLLSASWDQSVRLWDVETGMEIQAFEGHDDRILSAVFSGDNYILVGTGNVGNNIPDAENDRASDPSVWLWDRHNQATRLLLTGHEDWLWSVALSPDGQIGATGSGPISLPADGDADTTVRLWDTQTGAALAVLEGHEDTVHGLAFSPDGAVLASAGWDGVVLLWDVERGQPIGQFDGHEGRVFSVVFAGDGERAFSSGADMTIRQWEVDSGAEISRYEGHEGDINMIALSPDGQTIASASADQTVRLWDVETGDEIRRFEGHTGTVNGVAFSPDGTLLLSTSWDGTVRLWDVATGDEIRQFVGHASAVFGLAFSPDGRHAATGSSDLSVRVWDVASGAEIRRYTGHTNWVLGVAFDPAGDYIFTAAEDDTARVWRYAPDTAALVEWASTNRYIPELTCPQREQYRVEPLCGADES